MERTTIFGKNTAQAVVVNDSIMKFMATTKNKYSLNKDASMKAFFADCLYAVLQNPIARRWWKSSIELRKWFEANNIPSSLSFNELIVKKILTMKSDGFHMSLFKNYKELYDSAKKMQESGLEIDLEKLTKQQRKGAEYIMAHGRGLSKEELTDTTDENRTRLMAVRSKFGGTEVKFYNIDGGPINQNDPRINAIKAAYHYETGCKYFEARPILYSSWINLSPENQVATVMTDSSDM
jgi:hypothetical protein